MFFLHWSKYDQHDPGLCAVGTLGLSCSKFTPPSNVHNSNVFYFLPPSLKEHQCVPAVHLPGVGWHSGPTNLVGWLLHPNLPTHGGQWGLGTSWDILADELLSVLALCPAEVGGVSKAAYPAAEALRRTRCCYGICYCQRCEGFHHNRHREHEQYQQIQIFFP